MSASHPASPDSTGSAVDSFIADAARAADSARARLGGALNDLFRPSEVRLSDREHATMTRMLEGLVEEIARSMFPDVERGVAWRKLAHSRAMRDPELAGLLLRRADEHYLGRSLRAHFSGNIIVEGLTGHADHAIAEAASSLLSAESRRVDRFGEPLLIAAELPAAVLHRITWRIAETLDDPDRDLVGAVDAVFARHERSDAADRLARALAVLLHRDGELDDALCYGAFREGWLHLWVASLAVRSEVSSSLIWTMIADRDASRMTLLLRATGWDRTLALRLITDLLIARGGQTSDADYELGAAADAFDDLSVEAARALIRPWRSDDEDRVAA